jgi:hypothetical protein
MVNSFLGLYLYFQENTVCLSYKERREIYVGVYVEGLLFFTM